MWRVLGLNLIFAGFVILLLLAFVLLAGLTLGSALGLVLLAGCGWRLQGASKLSPVMATTWPFSCSTCTSRSLCSGLTRAKTSTSQAALRKAASSIRAISAPVTTGLPEPIASCAPMGG